MKYRDEASKFFLLSGLILLATFGSSLLVLQIRSIHTTQVERALNRSQTFIFVSLDRAQRIAIAGKNRYFFSYTGRYESNEFSAIEEVSSNYYHRHSEGKNVQAKIFTDSIGIVHSQLRKNKPLSTKRLKTIESFSRSGSYAGLFLFSLGFLTRWKKRNRLESFTHETPGREPPEKNPERN